MIITNFNLNSQVLAKVLITLRQNLREEKKPCIKKLLMKFEGHPCGHGWLPDFKELYVLEFCPDLSFYSTLCVPPSLILLIHANLLGSDNFLIFNHSQ